MSSLDDEIYPCVGVCMSDPETGYCLGCGRPPLGSPEVNIEIVPLNTLPSQAGRDQGE